MSSKWPGPGLFNVQEYQKSGFPFLTASNGAEVGDTTPVKVEFSHVTRWIEITPFANDAANYLKVGVTENGVLGRGAVTASIPSSLTDETTGLEIHKSVKPTPSAYEQSATARNWFAVPAGATTGYRMEIACKEIFLLTDTSTCGFSVTAGLTSIPRTDLNLTGSAGFFGVG